MERYPEDESRVLLRIVGFGSESGISDRLFCRIDDLVESLLSRLASTPIKVWRWFLGVFVSGHGC